MRAALALHLSPLERRALAAFAVLAGGFVVVTAVGVTVVMVVAADAEDWVDPVWAYALAAGILAAGCCTLGVRVLRRGWYGVRHGTDGLRFGRGLWVMALLYFAWAGVDEPLLAVLMLVGLAYLLVGLAGVFVAWRIVIAVRA
jgi:hypothetical protein